MVPQRCRSPSTAATDMSYWDGSRMLASAPTPIVSSELPRTHVQQPMPPLTGLGNHYTTVDHSAHLQKLGCGVSYCCSCYLQEWDVHRTVRVVRGNVASILFVLCPTKEGQPAASLLLRRNGYTVCIRLLYGLYQLYRNKSSTNEYCTMRFCTRKLTW